MTITSTANAARGAGALRRLGAAFLATVAATTGLVVTTADRAEAIAHGTDVRANRYLFSVKLVMTGIPTPGDGTRDSSCSGALIAARWVITAGHCFRDSDGTHVDRTVARLTTAIVGRTDLAGKSGQQATVIAVHQSATADVALAELDTRITDITPLRLSRTAPQEGQTLRLTGFGFTWGETKPAKKLQTGQFRITSVGESTISAAGRSPHADTSPCAHDSGGPYFAEPAQGDPTLVAVVSEGPTCPHVGADTAARTDNLTDWIAETIDTDTPGAAFQDAWWVAAGLLVAAFCGLTLFALLRRRDRNRRLRPFHRHGIPA